MGKRKIIKLLQVCFCCFLTLSCFVLLFGCSAGGSGKSDNSGSIEEEPSVVGDKATYIVEYVYEKVDGSVEMLASEFTATIGEDVVASPFVLKGYEFDSENKANVLSGKIEKSGSLRLKLCYRLIENDITVNSNANGEIIVSTENGSNKKAKYGATVSVVVQPKSGYGLKSVSVTTESGQSVEITDGKFRMPDEPVNLSAVIEKENLSTYVVQHYCQSLQSSGFELYREECKTMSAGEKATATPLNNDGLIQDENNSQRVTEGIVKEDGSLTLKLYYTRREFSVTTDGDSLAINVDKTANVKYGDAVHVNYGGFVAIGYSVMLYADGYEVNRIGDNSFVFDMPGRNVVLKAVLKPEKVLYKVEYYLEGDEENAYQLSESEMFYGETDSEVTAQIRSIKGYELNDAEENSVISGRVSGDGSLTLKAYYSRKRYTVTFMDLKGNLVESKTVRYGENYPVAPESSFYSSEEEKYFYWKSDFGRYDETAYAESDLTVIQKAYDGLIATKGDFYRFFGAIRPDPDKSPNGYYSTETVSGSYLLMSDIDFGGDTLDFYRFCGYLEGNGFALKNINVAQVVGPDVLNRNNPQGLFEIMDGDIRNVSFEGFVCTPSLKNYGTNLGVLYRIGFLAGELSGNLTNVYFNGTMRGLVYDRVDWDPEHPGTNVRQYPANDAEGKPVGGIVAYDATGATLKNIVIDVATEYRYGNTTTLSLIAGKGVFFAKNVFVVAAEGEETSGRTAARGISAEQIGVHFGKISQISGALEAAFNGNYYYTDVCGRIANGQSILKNENEVSLRRVDFTVNHYIETGYQTGEYTLESSETPQGLLYLYSNVEAKYIHNYIAQPIEQKIVQDGGATVVSVYYNRDDLEAISFDEHETDLNIKASASGGSYTIYNAGNLIYVSGEVIRANEGQWANGGDYIAYKREGSQGEKMLRINTGTDNVTIKIKLTDEMLDSIERYGIDNVKVSFYVSAMRKHWLNDAKGQNRIIVLDGTESGTIITTVQGVQSDWVLVTMNARDNIKDGYLTIKTQATGLEISQFFDDISLITPSDYTVKHYKETAIGSNEYEYAEEQSLFGITNEDTKAQPISYAGYSAQAFEQKKINEDGSTVVEIYYNKISDAYTVKHWIQTTLGGESYFLYEEEHILGNAGEETTAELKNIYGYCAPETITQKVIEGDNSTVVDVYYEKDPLITAVEGFENPETKRNGLDYFIFNGSTDDNANLTYFYRTNGGAGITVSTEKVRDGSIGKQSLRISGPVSGEENVQWGFLLTEEQVSVLKNGGLLKYYIYIESDKETVKQVGSGGSVDNPVIIETNKWVEISLKWSDFTHNTKTINGVQYERYWFKFGDDEWFNESETVVYVDDITVIAREEEKILEIGYDDLWEEDNDFNN